MQASILPVDPFSRKFKSQYNYGSHSSTVVSTIGLAQNQEYAVRFDVGVATLFDRIGVEVSTGAALNVIRLGIRGDDGAGYPLTSLPILDAGTVDASTTGAKTITIAQTLPVGRYWLVCVLQGGTGAAVYYRNVDPFDATAGNYNPGGYTQAGVTGALGTFPVTPVPTQVGPNIYMRVA